MLAQPDALLITGLLFGPLLVGVFQHLIFEPPARPWHSCLKKSPYRPPGYIFPIAWVWSYLSIGYASYMVYKTEVSVFALALAIPLYALHLVLINAWGYVVMVNRRVDHGLSVLLAVDVSASWLLVIVYSMLPFAAALCLPYFCWLLELTYLNLYMERNNPPSHTKEEVLAEHRRENDVHACDHDSQKLD